MNGAAPRARLASTITRKDAGAYFHTRSRVPNTSASSISNIDGAAVSAACVSAIVGGLCTSGSMTRERTQRVRSTVRCGALVRGDRVPTHDELGDDGGEQPGYDETGPARCLGDEHDRGQRHAVAGT